MQFDTALNVVWLVLGLIALASTIRAALYRTPASHRNGFKKSAAWLHVVGVALIVAALFPYISATDDVLRAEHFSAQHDHGKSGKHSRIDNLVRLYEAMDSPLLSEARKIILVFFFVSLIFIPSVRVANHTAPLQAGRSPPSLVLA